MTVAARNFAALTTEVLHDDFAAAKYTTRAQQALNEALGRVGRRVDSLQRRTSAPVNVVAPTDTYALPADFVRLVSLRNAAKRYVLEEVAPTEIDQQAASTGSPTLYGIDGSSLLIWPTPSAAVTLTLRYWATPAVMAVDADIPTIPADYVDLLVTYARSKLFRWEDDKQMADQLLADFERELGLARADLQAPSRAIRTRTPSMYDFGGRPKFARP